MGGHKWDGLNVWLIFGRGWPDPNESNGGCLVLSIVLLAIVGWRYHRKTWLKKLRIIDLGDQLSFQVGEEESRYAWSTLRRLSVRSSDMTKYKLDIFFEANTYRIEAWGPASKDLEQVARKLKAYLDQRGDQFDYC